MAKDQIKIVISGSQGAGKSVILTKLYKALQRSGHAVFGFDGEGRRMTKPERIEARRAEIVILTKQTYKKRKKS